VAAEIKQDMQNARALIFWGAGAYLKNFFILLWGYLLFSVSLLQQPENLNSILSAGKR
jgi:hypothetical protein